MDCSWKAIITNGFSLNMAQTRYTKHYWDALNMIKPVQEHADLELPTDSPPIQVPPQISFDTMRQRIEEIVKMFPNSIPTPEERLRTKIDVPFELKE